MLYSEIKEREKRFFLSLKIAIPFVIFLLFIFFIITTDIDVKSLIKNNIVAFLLIFFIYVYYILYQIYMGFKTSMIDNVTGAFSREYVLKEIDEKMKDESFLVVAVKITNIVDISERYGIKKTDKILKTIVMKIDDFFTEKGYKNISIGQIIGGNFIFLIDDNEKKINHYLKQFINSINNDVEGVYLNLVFSYIRSDSQNSAEEILISLFEELQIKSRDRRNPKRLNIKVSEFESLIVDLIKGREFDFRFQPILNLKNDKNEIYEVLIRLNSKKYGKISQREFISVVNRIGYENIFDIILIEEILKISSSYGYNKKFSVNISIYSLRNSKFLNDIKKLTKIYKDSVNNIILDISANRCIDDTIKLNENIRILKNLGFMIAVDNFGGDNTSFNYLKELDFDFVKFDMDYSKKYNQSKYNDILSSLIMIFKNLDTKTVVKFIESEDGYRYFKDVGVDYLQGYIVGKPINLDRLRSEM